MITEATAAQIKALRLSRGETQQVAADSIQVSVVSWQRYESGKTKMGINEWAVYRLGGLSVLEDILRGERGDLKGQHEFREVKEKLAEVFKLLNIDKSEEETPSWRLDEEEVKEIDMLLSFQG